MGRVDYHGTGSGGNPFHWRGGCWWMRLRKSHASQKYDVPGGYLHGILSREIHWGPRTHSSVYDGSLLAVVVTVTVCKEASRCHCHRT